MPHTMFIPTRVRLTAEDSEHLRTLLESVDDAYRAYSDAHQKVILAAGLGRPSWELDQLIAESNAASDEFDRVSEAVQKAALEIMDRYRPLLRAASKAARQHEPSTN